MSTPFSPRPVVIRAIGALSRILYLIVTVTLLLIAVMMISYALWEVWLAIDDHTAAMEKLLTAIGVAVIALALFDVSKHLVEEEVMHE